MLETHVNEWKYLCELNFHPNVILRNNEFMSFHKRSLLTTVDHFLSKMESLPLFKKMFLDSKDEYQNNSVKQLSQWITNTKLLFKTNRSCKDKNRKITEYFGKDSAREDNIPKIDLINKMISGKDTTNNKPNSNNYLNNKNKKLFRTSGKNIDNHIVTLGRNTK